MFITVKLYSGLRQHRFIEENKSYAAPITAAQVAAMLNISVDELGMVLINGQAATLDQELQEGDILSLFPLVGGG